MVQRIIFDLDDTLLDTGILYQTQLEELAHYVVNRFDGGLKASDVVQRQQEVDMKSLQELGFDKSRFPQSFEKTWESFCSEYNEPVKEKDLKNCRQLGWQVYDQIPKPLEGMHETLDKLKKQYDLILYTMGDTGIQSGKIRHHKMERWFSQMHIVPDKNHQTLRNILPPVPAEQTMIVGDSLRKEIKPGLDLGLKPVYCRARTPWHYHYVEIKEEFPAIESLPELFSFLPGKSDE